MYYPTADHKDIHELLLKSEIGIWNEQALPSYFHKVFVVRFVFWERVKKSLKIAKSGETVLDFGCGAGVLLPFLKSKFKKILIFDKDVKSLDFCKSYFKRAQFSNYLAADNLQSISNESLDCILALDVLEHIDDLESVVKVLKDKLKSNGQLIVSSPTENWVYKFARKFGGPGYQGEFHVIAAKEVEEILGRHFKVRLVNRIFPIFTFFRIVECTKDL